MKLNQGALLKSGGIGAVIYILVQICQGSAAFAPLLGPAGAGLIGAASIVAIVACLCGGIVALGIGFGYVYFAAQEGPVQMADGAIGGALATGIAGLLGGLAGACVGLAAPIAISAQAGASPDVAAALGAGIGGAIGAICGGLIGGAIVGAIGGVIGAATVGKPKTA